MQLYYRVIVIEISQNKEYFTLNSLRFVSAKLKTTT